MSWYGAYARQDGASTVKYESLPGSDPALYHAYSWGNGHSLKCHSLGMPLSVPVEEAERPRAALQRSLSAPDIFLQMLNQHGRTGSPPLGVPRPRPCASMPSSPRPSTSEIQPDPLPEPTPLAESRGCYHPPLWSPDLESLWLEAWGGRKQCPERKLVPGGSIDVIMKTWTAAWTGGPDRSPSPPLAAPGSTAGPRSAAGDGAQGTSAPANNTSQLCRSTTTGSSASRSSSSVASAVAASSTRASGAPLPSRLPINGCRAHKGPGTAAAHSSAPNHAPTAGGSSSVAGSIIGNHGLPRLNTSSSSSSSSSGSGPIGSSGGTSSSGSSARGSSPVAALRISHPPGSRAAAAATAAAAAAAALALHRPWWRSRWWVAGGLGMAVTSAGAVAAVYAVMAYVMKMAMVFSMAWKAAAGVAAAEGLCLGTWSYGAVREREMATGALAAANAQHAREVSSLQSLLRQEEYRQRHVMAGLVQANQTLVGKVESLSQQLGRPIAAANESASATHTAISMLAAHQEQVAEHVDDLSASNRQVTQLLLDIKEELLALQGGVQLTEPDWSYDGTSYVAGRSQGGSLSQEGAGGSVTQRRSIRSSVNEAVESTCQDLFANNSPGQGKL